MPELERRKAEISRRRQMNAPLNFEEINNHSKWVEETNQDQWMKRKMVVQARGLQMEKYQKASNYSSQYISAYKEEKRNRSVEEEKLKSERKAQV